MTFAFRLDPNTLRPDLGSDDAVQARTAELVDVLSPYADAAGPPHPDEAILRLELTLLHLTAGKVAAAAGVNVTAEARAQLLPGRKKADRVVKRHAKHLSRLGLALGWQWQGRYVHSTMLYLELIEALGDPDDREAWTFDRETQALTELCSATNDAWQGLWDDAATHFEQALMLAAETPVLVELCETARVAYRAARVMGEEAA